MAVAVVEVGRGGWAPYLNVIIDVHTMTIILVVDI